MDINTMPAGPEMDALVAEKVMGHKVGFPFTDSPDEGWVKDPNSMVGGYKCRLPRYSTDIAAAWEVVEKMKSTWGEFILKYGECLVRDRWGLHLAWCSPVCGYGETAPLAICRAAIKNCMEKP